MKALLDLERWVGKVESFFLAFSLIAMLSLTLYSVAYRNLVAPFVLKMQAAEMNRQPVAPAGAPAATAPAPAARAQADGAAAPVAATVAAPAAANAPSAGDLDDEPAAPAAKAVAAPAANAPSAGDLDDEPAAPAAKAVAAAPSAPSAGDLDDEPAAPAAGAAPAPSAPAAGATPPPAPVAPAAAAAVAPASPAPANDAPAALEVRQDSTFLRVLKSLNFAWIDKVTLHLLLWVGFFGAAIAAGKRKHIKIDALSRLIPAALRERLQILLDLVAAIACFFLANAALKFMASETASGTVFYGPVPGWAGILIIPVGFGLLMWHFLLDAVFEIALWAGNKTPALLAWKEELQRAQEEVA